MTLRELAEFTQTQIEVLYPDTDGNWYAHLTHVEVREPGMLASVSGRGKTCEEALTDYCKRIAGQPLVARAMQNNRIQFAAPRDLQP